MARHVLGGKRDDVTDQRVRAAARGVVAVVLTISPRRELVPLAGEHAFVAVRLEAHANAADTREQIEEAEARRVARVLRLTRALPQQIAQRGFQHRGTRRFTFFPATHRLDVFADMGCDFALDETGARLLEQVEPSGEGHGASLLGIFMT